MSKDKSSKKKRVVRTNKSKSSEKKRRKRKSGTTSSDPLVFGWTNYKFMLIGVGLIILGMVLMIGGNMPSPDVWKEDIIYSFRRTVIAPILIIAGLVVEIYAIFKD